MESEIKACGDSVRERKKMEFDFQDLLIQLKNVNRHVEEAQRSSKTLQATLKEKHSILEDAIQRKGDLMEQLQGRDTNLTNLI